jgi:TolA-binding protein
MRHLIVSLVLVSASACAHVAPASEANAFNEPYQEKVVDPPMVDCSLYASFDWGTARRSQGWDPPLMQKMQDALEFYSLQKYVDAAALFHSIMGDPKVDSVSLHRAQFWFGKSMYRVGCYEVAHDVFVRIEADPQHPFRPVMKDQAWDAMVRDRLSQLGRYPPP